MDEERRVQTGKGQTDHALHAELIGRPVLPPKWVILGGSCGGVGGEARLTLGVPAADEHIGAGPRLGRLCRHMPP